jgi:NAD(P)-dependent dehydrogenase (short-subunit alcohol dehydrogenase family)
MKVVVVGATGTIGTEVVRRLAREHEIIPVGRRGGDFQVDLSSKSSIERLFARLGSCDAVICTAGQALLGDLDELTDDDFMLGLTTKLMGQVNLVRVGRAYLSDYGSFTLTSGILSREPMLGSACVSMVNAGVEAFVQAAALEMKRGLRINAVSPVWATETLQALGLDFSPSLPAAQFAPAYQESLEGWRTGEVLDVRDFVPSAAWPR